MNNIYLDLTGLYNNRMVFPKARSIDENIMIGEANNYIFSESISFNQIMGTGNVSAVFRQRADGMDNLVCESQILLLDDVTVKKITIIGFCAWGYFKENLKLECVDGTSEYAKVYFSNVSEPLENGIDSCFRIEKALYRDGSRCFKEIEMKRGKGYIYYYTTEFHEIKKVNKIIFPENCLMHIFAVTINN